jgi:transcriptional regulator with XRE-family HTH domain
MGTGRLRNYIKSLRKRAGLSQLDLAFLLGGIDDTLVSKYENDLRMPPLEVALALQEIFQVPLDELFAGTHEPIAVSVADRVREFATRIRQENGEDDACARKLAWLCRCHGLQEIHNHTTLCTC